MGPKKKQRYDSVICLFFIDLTSTWWYQFVVVIVQQNSSLFYLSSVRQRSYLNLATVRNILHKNTFFSFRKTHVKKEKLFKFHYLKLILLLCVCSDAVNKIKNKIIELYDSTTLYAQESIQFDAFLSQYTSCLTSQCNILFLIFVNH